MTISIPLPVSIPQPLAVALAQLPPELSANLTLVVSQTPGRTEVGRYHVATGFIQGTVGQQNLFSIENPAGSGRVVYLRSLEVRGVAADAAAVLFLYRVGRTAGLPTLGGVLKSQQRATGDPAPVAIARQSPTANAAAGDMWVASPGAVVPQNVMLGGPVTVMPVDADTFTPREEAADVQLVEGEALLVRAGANVVTWRHWVVCSWVEALPPAP